MLFAILAQFHAAVPYMYRYNIGLTPAAGEASSISFTNKSVVFLLPLQLALSQFPVMVIPSLVGWAVGLAYRRELLPGYSWRVPKWILGSGVQRDPRQVETLRRRLETEPLFSATGADVSGDPSDASRRR